MRFRRRLTWRNLFLLACGILILRYLLRSFSPFLHVQLYHLQWHNHGFLYFIGLVSLLSKEPLVQIVNDHAVDVVFEIRHDPQRFIRGSITESPVTVYWHTADTRPAAVAASVIHDKEDIFVFRARLSDFALRASSFRYHIVIGSWKSQVYASDLFGRQNEAEAVRLGVLGDNQFAAVRFTNILNGLTSLYAPISLDALVHLGDAVQDAASARSWSTDFWRPLLQRGLLQKPIIMLRGNHDSPSVYTSAPRGKDELGYTSFFLSSANAFIIILDSNTDSELQDRYLAATLESDQAQAAGRRIVFVHIPPFVEYWDPIPWQTGEKLWGAFVRAKWVPLFQKYHIDLVVSGHQHNYQRGVKNGITYIIAGGAGGTLDHKQVENYVLEDSLTIVKHHFGILELDAQRGIHWKLYLEDGSLGDEVLI